MDTNGRVFDSLTGNDASDAQPLFGLASDEATATAKLNQVIYIDSVSFQKYPENEYRRFDELYFKDTNTGTIYSKTGIPEVTLKDGVYADLTLVAKVGGVELTPAQMATMKTKFMTWGGTFSGSYYKYVTDATAEGGASSTTMKRTSGFDKTGNDGFYRVQVTSFKENGLNVFILIYTDEKGISYRGYIMASIVSVTA